MIFETIIFVWTSCFIVFLKNIFFPNKVTMNRDGNDYNTNSGVMNILNNAEHTLKGNEFKESIQDYEGMFDKARIETGVLTSNISINLRRERYADMVNHFYNLVTDFYEWGWGQSFHFAPRFKNETFIESIKRAEYFLASRLGLQKKSKVLDVGCGIGGPMRNIARFSGADITGITINQYQVNCCNKYNQMFELKDQCQAIKGDFQALPFEANTFDAAYQIEATCHSPDRVATFSGIATVLKAGGLFAGYEWAMTDKYSSTDQDHVRIKEGIEVGNSLPTIVHYSEIVTALEKAGFEIVEAFDANQHLHHSQEIPWYDTLNGKMSLSGFRMTHLGRVCTHTLVWTLERLHIAPAGSTKVSALLNATAIDLVDSGKTEIFTPSFFFLARKL